ncbi:MAG: SH3 domain-containing protein [Candidatus Methanoperedens sp.]|nr:SH3 domain-containing protein [Candidatus Methanoperedens sp.]
MNVLRYVRLLLIGTLLFVLVPVVSADLMLSASPAALHLPASDWRLVTHNQCDDTLHWLNPSGEFVSIPRPTLPDEAATSPCSYRPMHISQDGRFLVQTATLTTGRTGVGFYDLQTGEWLQVHETETNEAAHLGHRYSSDANNQIAISFSTDLEGAHAWRVNLFDMTTGNALDELRSDGSEIAGFVGGEFLADALTVPYVVLVGQDEATGNTLVVIRFDGTEGDVDPFGAVVWYPQGAPGVGQELISSSYTAQDLDILPDGYAIYAYEETAFAAGPPAGEGPYPITSNAVAMLRPDTLGHSPDPELFFADGVSTVYGAQWAADGRIALFRRFDGTAEHLNWIKVGTAVLVPLEQQIAQVLGVPDGFVYNTADGIYYLSETAAAPTGPIFTDPALSGSMAFVWATAFGNPPLTLDTPAGPAPEVVPTLPIVTATPDTGICRIRSADGGNVNIRSGPGTAYPVLGQVPGTSELAITGYNGDWYVVDYAGAQGWMAGWVSTLLGNCAGLTFVAAPPLPPTEVPTGAVIEFWADTTSIAPGGCANIFWQVENISEVYFEGSGVAGSGSQNVCPAATTTYTLTVILLDGSTQTRTVTITVGGGGGSGQPDLFVSEFSLDPATPVQGQPVNVRIGVYNQGTAAVSATSFHIEWYPGENYPSPACTWDLDSMAASGGRILTCTYAGYPSWYASINTRVVVDTYNAVSESNEGNNGLTRTISVSAP